MCQPLVMFGGLANALFFMEYREKLDQPEPDNQPEFRNA
jgi:hypothetical protein